MFEGGDCTGSPTHDLRPTTLPIPHRTRLARRVLSMISPSCLLARYAGAAPAAGSIVLEGRSESAPHGGIPTSAVRAPAPWNQTLVSDWVELTLPCLASQAYVQGPRVMCFLVAVTFGRLVTRSR